MSDAQQRHAQGKRWSLPARIYLLGAVILAAGWIGGVLIYLSAASDEAGDLAYGISLYRSHESSARSARIMNAASMVRCMPIQIVLAPGSPSHLRPRKPPSDAIKRII